MNYKKNLALSNFYSKRGAHHLKTYLSTVRATVVKQEPQMHIWAMGVRYGRIQLNTFSLYDLLRTGRA